MWLTEVSFFNPSGWEVVDYIILEGQYSEFSICYTATQIFSLFWSGFYGSWRYKNSVPKGCIFIVLLAKH